MLTVVELGYRAVMTVGGPERVSFLQGLVSSDIAKAVNGAAVWGALLTPQGKFQFDFFSIPDGDRLLLDCEGGDRMMEFGRTLYKFKLRAEIDLGIAEGWHVLAAYGGDAPVVSEGVVFADPRLPEAGWRILTPLAADTVAEANGAQLGSIEDYDGLRIDLGLPDGSRDMQPGKAILLENGFDELHGVDWDKGCYMGQELTARTKYRGLIKKRLFPVELAFHGSDRSLAPGSEVLWEGRDAGEIKTVAGTRALALLRLAKVRDAVAAGRPLSVDGADVQVKIPDWMVGVLAQDAAE